MKMSLYSFKLKLKPSHECLSKQASVVVAVSGILLLMLFCLFSFITTVKQWPRSALLPCEITD